MQDSNKIKIFVGVLVLAIIIVVTMVFLRSPSGPVAPGQYDAFAQCLADKGATFYGAFWCPNCQNQKKLFGSSEKLLKYVECSTPNGQAQTSACTEQKIDRYPTWEFADSSRVIGLMSLEELSAKTSCQLNEVSPQE